ncbi:MAG: DNA-processing protein DprA [Owenweeksia sp.]
MNSDLLYRIGLTLIKGVGSVNAKSLIAHCGSAEAVFREKKNVLLKIPGIGEKSAKSISGQEILARAEEELQFMDREKITPLYYLDKAYPRRLKLCEDGPIMLYQKGATSLNEQKVLAMVGSRNATTYGKSFCQDFVRNLQPFQPIVVSGLAYGIDIASHKAALHYELPTVAVLGHGLDTIYPSLHRKTTEKIVADGGSLLSEFISGTAPDRENFPKRNRIIAGMSDAVIVVEAARKGGALITAEIANTYNRDVFAVPGRLGDAFSEGCNFLIKTNKAALISSVADLQYILGWEQKTVKAEPQGSLFIEMDEPEKKLHGILSEAAGKVELDQIGYKAGWPVSKVLTVLMALELKGVIKSHPGKTYTLR